MQVLTTWFGDFPEAESISRQVFSVSVAIIGLAAFAIVLALVEQVRLNILNKVYVFIGVAFPVPAGIR